MHSYRMIQVSYWTKYDQISMFGPKHSNGNFLESQAETDRQSAGVSLQHSLQVELLDLALQSAGQPGVHGGAARQDDVFVEVGSQVNVG